MGYSPAVTSGLQLLFDASRLSLADGASVSTMADQSGQGNNAAVPSGCSSPTFKATAFNGRPCVRMGGGTNGFGGSFTAWPSAGTGITCLLAINNILAAVSFAGFIGAAATANDYGDTGGFVMSYPSGGAANIYVTHGGSNLFTNILPVAPLVIALTLTSAASLFLGGGLSVFPNGSSASVNGTVAHWVIGQRYLSGWSTTNGGKFDFALASMYSRALSQSEAITESQAMSQYLGFGFGAPSIGRSPFLGGRR